MATKKKGSIKKIASSSMIIQFAVVFIFIAAIALVAYTVKMFL